MKSGTHYRLSHYCTCNGKSGIDDLCLTPYVRKIGNTREIIVSAYVG